MGQTIMRAEQVGARREGVHKGGIRQRYSLDEPGRRLLLACYDGRSATITDLARAAGGAALEGHTVGQRSGAGTGQGTPLDGGGGYVHRDLRASIEYRGDRDAFGAHANGGAYPHETVPGHRQVE